MTLRFSRQIEESVNPEFFLSPGQVPKKHEESINAASGN